MSIEETTKATSGLLLGLGATLVLWEHVSYGRLPPLAGWSGVAVANWVSAAGFYHEEPRRSE